MAGHPSTQTTSSRQQSLPLVDREDRLSKWLFFSFLFHGALILVLFIMPFLPDRSRPSYPIYTVDLVGGEKSAATIWEQNCCLHRFPRQHQKRRRRRFLHRWKLSRRQKRKSLNR